MTTQLTNLCDSLRATRELCTRLDREAWEASAPGFQGSTPGRHVRHILDHVRALLDAIDQSTPLRYFQRVRGGEIERSPEHALTAVDALLARLTDTPFDPERAIVVYDQCGDREVPAPSTVARELHFVWSHTCHHHAFLRLLLAQRLAFEERFGYARETPLGS